jgi:hypothetical protein
LVMDISQPEAILNSTLWRAVKQRSDHTIRVLSIGTDILTHVIVTPAININTVQQD